MRIALAGALAGALMLLFGLLVATPKASVVTAAAIGLYLAAFVRDDSRRDRGLTLLWAVPAGWLAICLAPILGPLPGTAAVVAIGLVFFTVYASELGARWPVVSQVALGGLIFALIGRMGWPDLAAWAAVMAAGPLAAALCHFALLPGTPQTTLARLDASLRRTIGEVLGRIEAALRTGGWTRPERRALLRSVRNLSGTATAAITGGATPHAAMRLFKLEMATERLARLGLDTLPAPGDRAMLSVLIGEMRSGRVADPGPQGRSAAGATPLGVSLGDLARLLDTAAASPPPAVTWPAASSAKGSPAFPSPGLRHAFQTAVACATAIACGELASPGRWYWAAIVAYLMFLGTRSRADPLWRGLRTVVGTLIGVTGGLLLAVFCSGSQTVSIIGIFVAVGMAVQASAGAFPVTVFWLSTALGLMLGVIGYVSGELLVPRLEETMAGAACGVFTAWLFLGTRISVVARKAGREMLVALTKVVRSASTATAGGRPDPRLPGLALTLQGRGFDFQSAARPRLQGFAGLADPALRRQVMVLSFCADWSNQLALSALRGVAAPSEERGAALRAVAERIANQAAVLSQVLDPAPGLDPSAPITAPRTDAEPDAPAMFQDDQDQSIRHLRLLLEIDTALEQELRRALRHP